MHILCTPPFLCMYMYKYMYMYIYICTSICQPHLSYEAHTTLHSVSEYTVYSMENICYGVATVSRID